VKLLVAGSRDFRDYPWLKSEIRRLEDKLEADVTEVVSGHALGADFLGEVWAQEHGVPWKEFRADWNIHGKSAGVIRNREMAEYCDLALIFWDGRSPGTKNMMKELANLQKSYFLHRFDKDIGGQQL